MAPGVSGGAFGASTERPGTPRGKNWEPLDSGHSPVHRVCVVQACWQPCHQPLIVPSRVGTSTPSLVMLHPPHKKAQLWPPLTHRDGLRDHPRLGAKETFCANRLSQPREDSQTLSNLKNYRLTPVLSPSIGIVDHVWYGQFTAPLGDPIAVTFWRSCILTENTMGTHGHLLKTTPTPSLSILSAAAVRTPPPGCPPDRAQAPDASPTSSISKTSCALPRSRRGWGMRISPPHAFVISGRVRLRRVLRSRWSIEEQTFLRRERWDATKRVFTPATDARIYHWLWRALPT
jgi:hypothetical protein